MVGEYLLHMDYSITEKRLTEVLHNYLNKNLKGFDECRYDWANYGCDLGECCDPYAIGFILPDNDYDNHLFTLVDGRYYDDDGDYPESMTYELPEVCNEYPDINDSEFNTIIIYEDMYETIRKIFGNIDTWRNSLLNILNSVYGFNAVILLSDVIYDW